MTDRPMLHRLGTTLGIQPSYVDQSGEQLRVTSDETYVRLLGAMGYDASTEESATEALRELQRAKRREWIAPVRFVRQRSRKLSRVRVRMPWMPV